MNFPPVGNKADHITMRIKSAETTLTIPKGTPVCLAVNGTDDGLAVVLPATAGAAKANSFAFGVALSDHVPNDYANAMMFGIVPYALVTRMTRAATTDSWTSSASVPIGELLALDTLNNAFLLESASLGSNNFLPFALLAAALVSQSASASATSDTRTAILVGARAFVRML